MNEPRPSSRQASSTSPSSSHIRPTHRSQQWRNRFRQLHILPHTYHYHNFLSQNSVYIKLYFNPTPPHRCYHQHGHFYIGSTAIGIPHREHNRRAKLKQLHNNIPVSAELSLRYWHCHNSIHHCTTIQLTSHDTYDQAWIQEHHHIANWMPTLNWPFISHHLKLKAQGWQFTKHRAHFYSRLATHKRLFRRLRLRQQTIREPHLYTSTKHHALTLLRDLTKHTAASFEAAKQLRSGRHTDLEVYAIRRMAANLEEPGRSRALHIINKALLLRNLTPPKPNIPLTVPFLAHHDFTKHCQQWLRTTIQQHKHLAIPPHLPSHRLREAAHKTLRSQLHNHRTWEETLHSPPDPADLPCACTHLRSLLQDPDTPTTNGHYILTLDQLHLPPHLNIFLNANMNSTYYPSKARYFLTFQTAYTKWLKLQGLPPSLTQHLEPFLEHQWRLHNTHLKQHPRFTARLLRQLQEHLGPHTVLHHADHELQQLRVFCQYFTGAQHMAISRTFCTTSIPYNRQYPRPPQSHRSLHPTHPLQVGLPQGLQHPIWSGPPQREKTLAERPHHHLLFPFTQWQPPTHHQPCPGHHSPTPLPPTFHPATLASFPLLPHPNPSRHLTIRHQR